MPRSKAKTRSVEDIVAALRQHGFDVADQPGDAKHLLVKGHGCGARLERAAEGGLRLTGKAMCIVAGELATLEDRGYQKFLVTDKLTVPATADQLRSLHDFSEHLKEVLGSPSFYNESLGTTSDRYMYDRVKGRA